MVYSPLAPYEVLQNRVIDFATVQRVRRFARFWDLVANSGRFPRTAPWIWSEAGSAFAAFLRFSDWLYEQAGRHHAIALPRLARFLADYLAGPAGHPRERVEAALAEDLAAPAAPPSGPAPPRTADQRQRRHRPTGTATPR